MREYNDQSKWQETHGKRRLHWGILTLADLPRNNRKYSRLIAQLKARYRAAKELSGDRPTQKSEDISV